MDFGLDEVQRGLRDTARAYLRAGPEQLSWDGLAGLGWLDPDLPFVARAVLAEECGYALAAAPWWPRLAMDLERTGRTGIVWPAGAGAPTVAPRGTGDSGRLDGVFASVPGLDELEEVVVAVREAGGVRLLVVPAPGPASPGAGRPGLDPDRTGRELVCRGARAETLAVEDPDGWLRDVGRRGLVLLAAEAVGVARWAYESAAAHARERVQFGRPVGSFQGVAFPVADAYVDLETAWSLTYWAAWVVEQGAPGPESAEEAIAAALDTARRAAVANCERAVQVFGAAGTTWDHPVHAYYRRALWIQAFGPSPGELAAVTASAVLGPAGVA